MPATIHRDGDLPILTQKQYRWVKAFLISDDATDAARQARYKGTDKVLGQKGYENKNNYKIKAYIAQQKEQAEGDTKAVILSRIQRQEFWTSVVRGENKNGKKLGVITMADKLRASELLGRSQADFTDNYANSQLKPPAPLSNDDLEELKTMATALTGTIKIKETA